MSVKREIEISDAVATLVELQVASGRYANFSSALQDAAWHHFVGSPSIFEEYRVTPEEVERAARRVGEQIDEGMAKGTLKVGNSSITAVVRPSVRAPLVRSTGRGSLEDQSSSREFRKAARPSRHWNSPLWTVLECRVGLGLRILFQAREGDFFLVTVGTHDQLHAFIKNLR